MVPTVNYWWPSAPSALSTQSFRKLTKSYQRTYWIAHFTPWLFYWWAKQKWYPNLVREGLLTDSDLEILKGMLELPNNGQVLYLLYNKTMIG